MLEMIEILKVKREFLYLLLTLTQEKNVKVSRFPLIHLDETILAHTNLAEFHKFLQEKENEALLDRMVIIKVPYTLSYKEEARIYQQARLRARRRSAMCTSTRTRCTLAAVFAMLTRLPKPRARRPRPHEEGCASTPARSVEGFAADRGRADARRVARTKA